MAATRYLNTEVMQSIAVEQFRARDPFPWANPQYFIRPEHYEELLESMPDVSDFEGFFGKQRKHGQAGHDRYVLDYEQGMALQQPWQDFIDELCSDSYRHFVCRLLDVRHLRFRFHWHYTPDGGEVSPHCDSKNKLGSQIFYLNTASDWNPAWGGETVVLDDADKFQPGSAPEFEDFVSETAALTADNRSLLFGRKGNSWHGVRRINCPPEHYRKVFIVVFENYQPMRVARKKVRRLLSGQPLVNEKERHMY